MNDQLNCNMTFGVKSRVLFFAFIGLILIERPVQAQSETFINQPSVSQQEMLIKDRGIALRIPRNYIISSGQTLDHKPILEMAMTFPAFSGASSGDDLQKFDEKNWWQARNLIILKGPASPDQGFTNQGLLQLAKNLHVVGLGSREVRFPFMGNGYVIVSPFKNGQDPQILACLDFGSVTRCRGYTTLTQDAVFMYEYDSTLIGQKDEIDQGIHRLLQIFAGNH